MVDAGSGLSNFDYYKDWIKQTDTIHIVLSHYHLDHVVGLVYLLNICRKHKLRIWGPGKPFYPNSCEEILKNLICPPYLSRPIEKFTDDVQFFDYSPGVNTVSDEFAIEVFEQAHTDPSFGLLINNSIYYATDTLLSDETFNRASKAGVQLLLHECWDLENGGKQAHTNLTDLLKLAEKHPTLQVGLIHLNPNWTKEDYQSVSKKLEYTSCFLTNDGDEYEVK